MDFDDHRDYMDQDDPAGQFPTVDSGPIHQFFSGIPDWLNFNPEDLDRALESLPIPLKGPVPPGMSLQDASFLLLILDQFINFLVVFQIG
jgi:hypothetical protein